MEKIALSRLHFPILSLGPGKRIGIWLQGCSIRCPGCISADTWAPGHETMAILDLIETLTPWLREASGITVTGGEPFEQLGGLHALLLALREITEADILVFTGFDWAEIERQVGEMDGLIDALMTGPYRPESGQTRALRGSDNQVLHLLTSRGHAVFEGVDRKPPSNRLDMMMSEDGEVYFAGIPAPGDFQKLRAILEEAGHEFVTTEDRRHT